ncbi:hypothetical protein KCP70_03995 [Salmonella enterica subsp. enterica]|nr:hypothetical protein KCP70_03995 [Salmonella enterica subsp. enterica]
MRRSLPSENDDPVKVHRAQQYAATAAIFQRLTEDVQRACSGGRPMARLTICHHNGALIGLLRVFSQRAVLYNTQLAIRRGEASYKRSSFWRIQFARAGHAQHTQQFPHGGGVGGRIQINTTSVPRR